MRPDAALSGVQAVVEIVTDSGTLRARCEHPRGSAENPLSRSEIADKCRTDATGVLEPTAIAAVIGKVANLEDLGSTAALMDLLRAPPRRSEMGRAAS